jgi:uncharacterized sulfatase
MQVMGAGAAVAGLRALGRAADEAAPAKPGARRPNIVLLISDDDDYEHFGFTGNQRVRTPTLDRLAASGVVFTRAHVPAPLCRPCLASMLSGRLPHQHGIYGNYLDRRGIGADRTKLDPAGSLPNRLKSAGYATYATAKYWEGDPRKMGFTHGTVEVTFKGFGGLVRHGQDELFGFVDDHKGKNKKPMFIWWAPLVPHGPHNPPARLAKRFAKTPVPIPPYFKGNRRQYVAQMRKFYAMGTWFDEGVANLIRKLKDAGEYENTLFLFYVDNGWTIGTPAKSSPYEKGLRTPMFVAGPGVGGGKRVDGLTYALDLHATILDYAGVQPGKGIASQSLRPLIEGKTDRTHEALHGAVFAHAPFAWPGDKSVPRSPQRDVYALYVRTDRWKYVLYTQDIGPANERYIWIVHKLCPMPQRRRGQQNLFDLNADPYEMTDLAAKPEHRQRLAEFRKQALDWWRKTGGKPLQVDSAKTG